MANAVIGLEKLNVQFNRIETFPLMVPASAEGAGKNSFTPTASQAFLACIYSLDFTPYGSWGACKVVIQASG